MNMNIEPPVDPGEWDAQERGRLAAAQRGEATASEPGASAYLQVALALRSAPLGEPPPGFAAEVAACVSQCTDDRTERVFVRSFGVVVGVALAAVLVLYGPQCWEAMRSTMTEGSLRLLMATAGCLGVSLAARRRLESRPAVPATGVG